MDNTLTERLRKWLGTPAAERNTEEGETLILMLMRNKYFAANFVRNPQRFMAHAEYQLGKFLTLRTAQKTHEEVARMTKQADAIVKKDGLDQPIGTKSGSKKAVLKALEKTDKFVKGRRPDHDQLPEEIQALYKENLNIVQQKRAIHAQLIVITKNAESKDYCPDGDRYPLVKELIELDKRERQNWEKYDGFTVVSQ